MKPWRYGKVDRNAIEMNHQAWISGKRFCSWSVIDGCEQAAGDWRNGMSIEIHAVLKHWEDFEDKEEAERYLEYLKFLFILAGGEPCGW